MAEVDQKNCGKYKGWHLVLTFIIGVGIGLASILAPAYTQEGRIFNRLDTGKVSDSTSTVDKSVVFTDNELRELDDNLVVFHGKVQKVNDDLEKMEGMFFTESEGMFFQEGANWNELGEIVFEDGKIMSEGKVLIDTGMFFSEIDKVKSELDAINQGMEATCSKCVFY